MYICIKHCVIYLYSLLFESDVIVTLSKSCHDFQKEVILLEWCMMTVVVSRRVLFLLGCWYIFQNLINGQYYLNLDLQKVLNNKHT